MNSRSDHPIIRPAKLPEIIDLRHQVLRVGLPRETAIFPGDELATSRHFGAFAFEENSQRAVGCATFHASQWEGEPAWQLRGMATAADFRGQGLGRQLLQFAEQSLSQEPDTPAIFWCNARVPAVGFYRLMGWEVVSEEFDIPSAGPHVRMLRRVGI